MKPLLSDSKENKILIGTYIEKSKKIFMVLMGIISLFELALFIRGILVYTRKTYKNYVYLSSYVVLFAASVGMLLFLLKCDIARNNYSLCNRCMKIYLCVIVLWSVVISSLDMTSGRFPIVYMTVIITIACAVIIEPRFYLILCVPSLISLYGLDSINGFNFFVSSGDFINVFVFASMSVIINRRQYEGAIKEFKANETLLASIAEERRRVSAISLQTIQSIINTVDAKDKYTREHSQRVAEYSVVIAEKLGWSEEKIKEIREIALLHDIGKIGVPDYILNCAGKLSAEEFEMMKQHTTIGAEILQDLTILPRVSIGARHHHERYDGTGYPDKLKGEEIPIEARIIAVADSFDAMSSNRVYREHLGKEKILSELEKGRGTQFDPHIIDIFISDAKKILNRRQDSEQPV